jgi:hypothetical protein
MGAQAGAAAHGHFLKASKRDMSPSEELNCNEVEVATLVW